MSCFGPATPPWLLHNEGMRLFARLSGALLLILAVPDVAGAGPLGKVVGGMHGAAGGRGSGGGRGTRGAATGTTRQGREQRVVFRPGRLAVAPVLATTDGCCAGVVQRSAGGARASVAGYFGFQDVADSNGALSFELRVFDRRFGVAIHDRSYWEDPGPGGAATTRLDLWALAPQVKLLGGGGTELWLEAGVAGVRASPDLSLYGAEAGARLEQRLGGELSVLTVARGYVLQDGVAALELQVGVRVGMLLGSYRVVDFDVGPPLGGPELGIAFQF